MINFSYFLDVFIGVVFPSRFLGFMSDEIEHNSKTYRYCFFCSLDIDSFCFFRKRHRSHFRVSNLPYHENWDSELDYLKSLDRANRNVLYPRSVYGKLGVMGFGFDSFGVYVATNLRNITGKVSRDKILNLRSFSLYQLETLKDPPVFTTYPIGYKYNVSESRYTLVEGLYGSCDFFGSGESWASRVFIEFGFRNPKDIMIYSGHNQFKHWSDVFLNRLGIGIYRI